MKKIASVLLAGGVFAGGVAGYLCWNSSPPPIKGPEVRLVADKDGTSEKDGSDQEAKIAPKLPKVRPMAPFTQKAIEWLVKAQHESGAWGAGSHQNQQLRDPHAVKTDPATTAFAAMALLRAGHTPVEGKYKDAVRKATERLIEVVEKSSDSGPKITDITGTQPQAKLGPIVDTSMTAQFLARVVPTLPAESTLRKRASVALDKCISKIQSSQQKDGSWNVGGGWAPVLQSSFGCTALELAEAAGRKIDRDVLEKARKYQTGNIDAKTGKARADRAAGVELYAFAAGQRAAAQDARLAEEVVERAKRDGKLGKDEEVSVDNLRKLGVKAPQAKKLANANAQVRKQNERLNDAQLIAGFGNNGGEEFLSFMLTSESLVIVGGDKWDTWNDKMHKLFAKVQSPDGSYSGHHCITSPVFCTAAVIQCVTADRDAKLLLNISGEKLASRDVEKKDAAAKK